MENIPDLGDPNTRRGELHSPHIILQAFATNHQFIQKFEDVVRVYGDWANAIRPYPCFPNHQFIQKFEDFVRVYGDWANAIRPYPCFPNHNI